MANQTISAYEKYASVAIKNWTKPTKKKKVFRLRDEVLDCENKTSKRILDLGCGPGNDTFVFAKAGWSVVAVDAVDEFLKYACKRISRKYKVRFIHSDFMKLNNTKLKNFDVIWANASLIHLPKKTLPVFMKKIGKSLKPEGIVAATFYHGRDEAVYTGSFVPGRLFSRYLKDELNKKFEQAGFSVELNRVVNNEHRGGRWIDIIAKKS